MSITRKIRRTKKTWRIPSKGYHACEPNMKQTVGIYRTCKTCGRVMSQYKIASERVAQPAAVDERGMVTA